MKRINISILTAVILFVMGVSSMAQNTYVNQVLIGAGGNYSDPDENVTISTFNPNDESVVFFGEVLTHSIQDIAINGSWLYVAAQDSIAKFNIDTYERVAITAAPGINQLYVHNNILFASYQYPVTENFVRVYSAEDLSLLENITSISDECAGMIVEGDNLYVAVPGGWASTIGKIAIIGLSEYELLTEVPLGSEGIGVFDLFYYNNKIMSVNRTPYLGTTGYISEMSLQGTGAESHMIDQVIGKLAGVKDNMMYTIMNNGIGSINLDDFTVGNSAIIAPQTNTMAAAALDTVNNLFYFTTTDYFSSGAGYIYDISGEALNTFEAMISAETIEIDYRDNTGIAKNNVRPISVYPNPSSSSISFEGDYNTYSIVDLNGRIIKTDNISGNTTIGIESMESGLYILHLSGDKGVAASSFIKN